MALPGCAAVTVAQALTIRTSSAVRALASHHFVYDQTHRKDVGMRGQDIAAGQGAIDGEPLLLARVNAGNMADQPGGLDPAPAATHTHTPSRADHREYVSSAGHRSPHHRSN